MLSGQLGRLAEAPLKNKMNKVLIALLATAAVSVGGLAAISSVKNAIQNQADISRAVEVEKTLPAENIQTPEVETVSSPVATPGKIEQAKVEPEDNTVINVTFEPVQPFVGFYYKKTFQQFVAMSIKGDGTFSFVYPGYNSETKILNYEFEAGKWTEKDGILDLTPDVIEMWSPKRKMEIVSSSELKDLEFGDEWVKEFDSPEFPGILPFGFWKINTGTIHINADKSFFIFESKGLNEFGVRLEKEKEKGKWEQKGSYLYLNGRKAIEIKGDKMFITIDGATEEMIRSIQA